jgi:hypothetical protein
VQGDVVYILSYYSVYLLAVITLSGERENMATVSINLKFDRKERQVN